MSSSTTEMATSAELFDAVKTIARAGDKHHGAHEWVGKFNGMRFFYGERHGMPDAAYGDVVFLQESRKYPVHHEPQPGQPMSPPNAKDAITGTVTMYKVHDDGKVVCFRSGDWAESVLKEAERIKSLPPKERALALSLDADIEPFVEPPVKEGK